MNERFEPLRFPVLSTEDFYVTLQGILRLRGRQPPTAALHRHDIGSLCELRTPTMGEVTVSDTPSAEAHTEVAGSADTRAALINGNAIISLAFREQTHALERQPDTEPGTWYYIGIPQYIRPDSFVGGIYVRAKEASGVEPPTDKPVMFTDGRIISSLREEQPLSELADGLNKTIA